MAKQLNRREFMQWTALGAGATLLAACAPGALPSAPAAQPAAGGAAAPATGGGTLVFGYPQKTTYGNFCVPWNYAGTQDVYSRRLAYSGLIQWNNDYSDFLPDLAEKWEFDGNKCTFTLRKDVKWHDGQPFNADDVIFTYLIVGNKDSLWTSPENLMSMVVGFKEYHDGTAKEITGITKTDDFTVVFELTDPYRRPFLNSIASYVIDPKHLLSDKPLEELLPNEGLCKTPWALETGIGTGPFKVSKYVPDQYVEFARNDDYYRAKMKLDKIVYTAYTDGQAQAAALESGECHVGTVPPSEYPRFKEMTHVDVVLSPSLANTAFFLNFTTIDKKVRQAMWWAIDREAIVQSFYHGATTVPGAIFEYGGYGVGPDVPQYTYDPEKAKALLKEANWDGSRKLRFMVESVEPANEPLYSLVLGFWKAVGIDVEYQVVGADYGNIELDKNGTDILFSGQVWGADASDGANYYLNAPDKFPFVDVPEAPPIVKKISVSENSDEIKEGVYALQALGADVVSVIPIARSPGIWVINKKVKGGLHPVYALWTRNDWQWENITVEA
ncbi:oligopeptide ABC transporter substrate-binding protein [soil metagenome]